MNRNLSPFGYAIVLDFEATCDDRKRLLTQEIIEFPSVVFSLDTFEIIDEFQAFVKPHHHPVLTEFCQKLTAIRQHDVDTALPFADVFAKYQAWLHRHKMTTENAVIVTCGDWDLGTMLPAQCATAVPSVDRIPALYARWHNIKRSFCSLRRLRKAPGMTGMLRALGLQLVGHHHRGIDDCRNIAALCRSLIRKGAVIDVTKTLAPPQHAPLSIKNDGKNGTEDGYGLS